MSISRRGEGRVRATAGAALRCTGGEDCTRGEDTRAVPLDVREDHEWNAGHAPGAIQVAISSGRRSRMRAWTAAGHPVAVARGSTGGHGNGDARRGSDVDVPGNDGPAI